MPFNQTDLDNQLKDLHFQIIEKRKAYDEGVKKDLFFEELKKLFVEIKELEKRLEQCYLEVNAQREN